MGCGASTLRARGDGGAAAGAQARRQRDGRAWRYAPALTRQAYTAQLMREALAVSDDRAGVLARFVEEIDPADAEALAAALREVTDGPDAGGGSSGHGAQGGGSGGGSGGGPDGTAQ